MANVLVSPIVEVEFGDIFNGECFDISIGSISIGSNRYPYYEGRYEVTPTQEQQILYTKNTVLSENIVVDPIPHNYGLITWNGSFIRVS